MILITGTVYVWHTPLMRQAGKHIYIYIDSHTTYGYKLAYTYIQIIHIKAHNAYLDFPLLGGVTSRVLRVVPVSMLRNHFWWITGYED